MCSLVILTYKKNMCYHVFRLPKIVHLMSGDVTLEINLK